jgi:hypothetical protein
MKWIHGRLERIWDPILVPGAKKKISFSFLKSVSLLLDFCYFNWEFGTMINFDSV